jgi:hypothetical protein
MPKKRSRIADIDEEQNTNMLEPMQVEDGRVMTGAAGSNITMQQNPLFDVNVYWQDLRMRPARKNELY